MHHLAESGVDARGASRHRPDGLVGDWVELDAREPDRVRQAAQDADAVIVCAAPPLPRWAAEFEVLVRGTLEGVSGLNTSVAFASNMSPYGPSAKPLSENTAQAPSGPAGRLRKGLDSMVLAANTADRVRTAVVRGSSFYGPGVDVSVIGASQITSAAEGTAINALGSVDQPHSLCFIDDFARALVRVAADTTSPGEIWHAPVQPAMTMRHFMTLLTDQFGTDPKFRIASPLILTVMGLFNPNMRALKESMYQFTAPFIVDDAKYCSAFSDSATELQDTIRSTIEGAGLRTSGSA